MRATETASHQPLFTVAQVDIVRVRVMVPEKDAPWVHEGNHVLIKLQSLPGREFVGKVSRMSDSLDESTRTMLVEVDLPNPQGALLPGMFAALRMLIHRS